MRQTQKKKGYSVRRRTKTYLHSKQYCIATVTTEVQEHHITSGQDDDELVQENGTAHGPIDDSIHIYGKINISQRTKQRGDEAYCFHM